MYWEKLKLSKRKKSEKFSVTLPPLEGTMGQFGIYFSILQHVVLCIYKHTCTHVTFLKT